MKIWPIILITILCSILVHASLSDGLIAYYTFDDGTFNDQSGNGYNGVNHGALPITGKYGDAMKFNNSAYATLDSVLAPISTGTTGTICMWVNESTYVDGGVYFGVSHGTVTTDYFLLQSKVTQTHFNYGYKISNSFQWDQDIANIIGSGYWQYMCIRQSGTNVTMFFNGTYQSSVVSTKWFADDTSLASVRLGDLYYSSAESFFSDSTIDEVVIYNRSLSVSEIQELYNGISPTTISITAYNITSAYANQTYATGSNIAYTRHNTPSIDITLGQASNVSCGLYNKNYSAMVANNSDTQAATTDTTSHTCTIPSSEALSEGINKVYVSVLGSGSVAADAEYNISLDWSLNVSTLYSDDSVAANVSILGIDRDTNNTATGPANTFATALSNSTGGAMLYFAFPGNYTSEAHFRNGTTEFRAFIQCI